MRNTLLGAVVVAVVSIASAQAQPPEELNIDHTITMQSGETRIYQFEQVVNQIDLVQPIAEIKPQTDRTFTIRATGAGSTILTAYNGEVKGQTVVFRARLVVEGRLVRIYGQGTRRGSDEGGGYAGYLCTSTGCGRANPDFVRGPDRVTITEDAKGNVQAVEKEYR
ncbi:pilus assembly protein N-terminal domain-containing protein [Bradyrhizobium sp. PRIMUS42]|uniref:pilus assembly protein N-terminal domain-containing protein n=1 Tax=Bradyrhizobium sp. PRIMUS42 TaxID=2908926 RepID=UPI001FF246D7|nr:pilus assembly protein N-terminal domain-containing protein [Bradyrhizobium sp. PRIMUS42]MCJ9731194.1 pilus assembly protein N-terminal domain-containing protein [Bradyrhizobium sp. PRIMUS42]